MRSLEANGKQILLAQLKTQVKQADPSFEEKSYGFDKFKDLIGALIKKNLLPYAMKTEKKVCFLVPQPARAKKHTRKPQVKKNKIPKAKKTTKTK